MQEVAVAIEATFGIALVESYMIFCTEFFGFGPGCRFDLEKLDVLIVIVLPDKIMAELMQKQEIIIGVGVLDSSGWMKKIAVAGREGEIRVILAQAREEIILRVFLALWHSGSSRKLRIDCRIWR